MKLHKLYKTTLKSDFIILHCYENEKFAFKKEDVVNLDFVEYYGQHEDNDGKGKWQQILEKSRSETYKKLQFFMFWILIPLYLFIFIMTFLHSGWYPREVNVLNAIIFFSIPVLTVLYYLANIIRFSLSASTFENLEINGKTSFILQILDSKNKQYFFKDFRNYPDGNSHIINLLDFFDYHLCSVDSKSIHIKPKNEKSDLQTNYFFKFQFSFKSYGLEHFQSFTFGFLFYCLIFSFCFSETYLISDPWVRFPVYIVIIPFIICMYLLLVLVRGVYEKIKRKTFFNTGGGLALQLNFLKGYEGDHSNFRPLKSTDPNSDKTMIQFNLNNWPHRFISEFNGDILFKERGSKVDLFISTNDGYFEKWWIENFGRGGFPYLTPQKKDLGYKIYKLDDLFYDKFGIEPLTNDLYLNKDLFSFRKEYLNRIAKKKVAVNEN
jgi:hypothetical protein